MVCPNSDVYLNDINGVQDNEYVSKNSQTDKGGKRTGPIVYNSPEKGEKDKHCRYLRFYAFRLKSKSVKLLTQLIDPQGWDILKIFQESTHDWYTLACFKYFLYHMDDEDLVSISYCNYGAIQLRFVFLRPMDGLQKISTIQVTCSHCSIDCDGNFKQIQCCSKKRFAAWTTKNECYIRYFQNSPLITTPIRTIFNDVCRLTWEFFILFIKHHLFPLKYNFKHIICSKSIYVKRKSSTTLSGKYICLLSDDHRHSDMCSTKLCALYVQNGFML